MLPITDGRSKAGSIAFLELRQYRTAAVEFPISPPPVVLRGRNIGKHLATSRVLSKTLRHTTNGSR